MKQIAVTKMVVHRSDEGKPVFAIFPNGAIRRIGWTTSGPGTFDVPDEAVALAWVLHSRRDAALFIAEPCDGLPEKATLTTWRQSVDANRQQLAAELGVPENSDAVLFLMGWMYRFGR